MNSKKVLIISEFGPPTINGPSSILWNLFTLFPEGSFCILMDDLNKSYNVNDRDTFLNCKYYFFRLFEYKGTNRFISNVVILIHFLLIPLIILRALKIINNERISTIFAPNNNGPFLIAAFLTCKITKKPLFIYLLDLYKYAHTNKIKQLFASYSEGKILLSAKKVYVMSTLLKEHYEKNYNINTCYMPHPVNLGMYVDNAEDIKNDPNDANYKIVFTGLIYHAQLDSILNMVNVVNSLRNVKLYLYTPLNSKQLAKMGIYGQNIVSATVPRQKIPQIQKNADILFLPIAFNNTYPVEYIKAASPSKMPEYLAAKRPILVHAPPYAYINYYSKKHGFALVVDDLDQDKLKQAVKRLLDDSDLQKILIKNSSLTAALHDRNKISSILQDDLLN